MPSPSLPTLFRHRPHWNSVSFCNHGIREKERYSVPDPGLDCLLIGYQNGISEHETNFVTREIWFFHIFYEVWGYGQEHFTLVKWVKRHFSSPKFSHFCLFSLPRKFLVDSCIFCGSGSCNLKTFRALMLAWTRELPVLPTCPDLQKREKGLCPAGFSFIFPCSLWLSMLFWDQRMILQGHNHEIWKLLD